MAAATVPNSEAETNANTSVESDEAKSGELLICGAVTWDVIGRRNVDVSSCVNLPSPTRLAALQNISIACIASGAASCHCVALDVDGRCYTWGRNEKGQLGQGDLLQRNSPTIVSALARYVLVKAGAGRHHTVVVTEEGNSLAFGWNKHGQLGAGFVKEEAEKLPLRVLLTEVTEVVCGAEFTVWLSSTTGSTILSAGLPQYGQLGHGTDNEYNSKEGSVRLVYEPQPRPRAIASLTSKTMTKVACGHNHTVAVDADGYVYTWGFGGHGRLGHKEQKDEWVPRVVDLFQRGNLLPSSAVVAAGSAYSACTAGGGQLYMWGRVKTTGDNWMYPKPVMDLNGWTIRSMDCGNSTSVASAESSCISWGTAVYGELGYGPTGPKSSSTPKKVDTLEGMHVISVACGAGHSLFLVDRKNVQDRLDKLEVYAGQATNVQAEEKPVKISNDSKKRKVAPVTEEKKPKPKPSKKKEVSDESEAESEEPMDESAEDESDEPAKSRKPKGSRGRGKAKGTGRGRVKQSGSAPDVKESSTKKGTGRAGKGRGRGDPSSEDKLVKAPQPKKARGRTRKR